jgi:hypothetical protein
MTQEEKQRQEQPKEKKPMPEKVKQALRKAVMKAHEDWKNGVRR